MSKPRSIYMWENVEKIIQIIDSEIDLIYKTTDLYDSQYCSKDNDDCLLKYYHIIGEFVQMKKHLSLRMGLNHTVHQLMDIYLIWKVVFIKD